MSYAIQETYEELSDCYGSMLSFLDDIEYRYFLLDNPNDDDGITENNNDRIKIIFANAWIDWATKSFGTCCEGLIRDLAKGKVDIV